MTFILADSTSSIERPFAARTKASNSSRPTSGSRRGSLAMENSPVIDVEQPLEAANGEWNVASHLLRDQTHLQGSIWPPVAVLVEAQGAVVADPSDIVLRAHVGQLENARDVPRHRDIASVRGHWQAAACGIVVRNQSPGGIRARILAVDHQGLYRVARDRGIGEIPSIKDPVSTRYCRGRGRYALISAHNGIWTRKGIDEEL